MELQLGADIVMRIKDEKLEKARKLIDLAIEYRDSGK